MSVCLDGERVCDYEMKLMNIDQEHLGIPVSAMIICKYCISLIPVLSGH